MSDKFADNGADGDEMSRRTPILDSTADSLLAGGIVGDPTLEDLARVLATASAPGTARELRREDAATAAFAAARQARRPAHRKSSMFRPVLANALGLKLAAATLAAVATGGIALAASTGVLPNPLHPGPSSQTPGAGITGSAGDPSGNQQPTLMPSPHHSDSSESSLRGLCTAYLSSTSAAERNKHLVTELIAAAGGAERVEAYCGVLVGSPSETPRPRPDRSIVSSDKAKPTAPSTR